MSRAESSISVARPRPTRREIGHPGIGGKSNAGIAAGDGGGVADEPDIGGECEGEAGPGGGSVDGGDDGGFAVGKSLSPASDPAEIVELGASRFSATDPADVFRGQFETGAEAAASAREQDAADGAVGGCLVNGLRQLVFEDSVYGIQFLGAVESNDADAFGRVFNLEMLVIAGHPCIVSQWVA
jgi:hypothetical protein